MGTRRSWGVPRQQVRFPGAGCLEWGESLKGLRGGDRGGVNGGGAGGGGAGGGGASAGGSGPGPAGVAAGSLRRGRAQTSPQPREAPLAPSSRRAQVGASPSRVGAGRPSAAGPLLGAPLGGSAPLHRLPLSPAPASPRPSPVQALPSSPRGQCLWVCLPRSARLGWVSVCGPLSLWVGLSCISGCLCVYFFLLLRLSLALSLRLCIPSPCLPLPLSLSLSNSQSLWISLPPTPWFWASLCPFSSSLSLFCISVFLCVS